MYAIHDRAGLMLPVQSHVIEYGTERSVFTAGLDVVGPAVGIVAVIRVNGLTVSKMARLQGS